MRIRMPMGRTVFFLAAFAFSLVALFPLRLALDWFGLDDRGLAAREASGSIWLGALREAQVGPVPIGDVSARLNSLPLFLGRARVSLVRRAADGSFAGALLASRHSFAFEDVTGQLRLGGQLAPLPIAALDLDDFSAGFADGQCRQAGGMVRATLAGDLGGIVLPSGLSGTARCDAGAVLLPLASQSGMEQLNLRLFPDGRYRAELLVRPTDPATGQRLAAAGFAPAGNGFARLVEGSF
jgi:general secretion pathway protein N